MRSKHSDGAKKGSKHAYIVKYSNIGFNDIQLTIRRSQTCTGKQGISTVPLANRAVLRSICSFHYYLVTGPDGSSPVAYDCCTGLVEAAVSAAGPAAAALADLLLLGSVVGNHSVAHGPAQDKQPLA